MALTRSSKEVVRGRPPDFAGGNKGRMASHSASDTSLGYLMPGILPQDYETFQTPSKPPCSIETQLASASLRQTAYCRTEPVYTTLKEKRKGADIAILPAGNGVLRQPRRSSGRKPLRTEHFNRRMTCELRRYCWSLV